MNESLWPQVVLMDTTELDDFAPLAVCEVDAQDTFPEVATCLGGWQSLARLRREREQQAAASVAAADLSQVEI
jgi:hypothetical protein